jgi:hypothetical protein
MNKKKFIILSLFIIIIVCLFAAITPLNVESFSDELKQKIVFHNWWGLEEEKSVFYELFSGVADKFDEIQICSPGAEPNKKSPKTLLVNFSGESHYNDPNKFDVNLLPVDNCKNLIVFPFASYHVIRSNLTFNDNSKINLNRLCEQRKLNKDLKTQKFCLFAVSNPNSEIRKNFFTELNKVKNVDSCGSVLNNTGDKCPGRYDSEEYMDYINQYKFMICFENVSQPNYFTEKLINSYYFGTIPIYWGCPNIGDYVDVSSILYLKPDFTQADVDALIKEIQALDSDDELYKKKYESVFFKNGSIPDAFNLDKLKEKINAQQ